MDLETVKLVVNTALMLLNETFEAETKADCMQLLGKISEYLATFKCEEPNVSDLKKELNDHIEHFYTSKEVGLQKVALEKLNVNSDSLKTLVISIKNGDSKIRNLIYDKLIEFNLKPFHLQKDTLFELVQVLMDEKSEYSTSKAMKVLECLFFTSNSTGPKQPQRKYPEYSLMRILDSLVTNSKFIPSSEFLIIKDLLHIVIVKNTHLEEIVESEGLPACQYLTECGKMCDSKQTESLDFTKVTK